jgi:anti-anti-sigma factor
MVALMWRRSMGVQNLTEEIVLVTLPKQPQGDSEIERATRMIHTDGAHHVIIDFSLVDMISSSTISELIIIENELHEVDRQLVLCSVPQKIQRLLTQVGLQSLFRCADNEFAALQLLNSTECWYG